MTLTCKLSVKLLKLVNRAVTGSSVHCSELGRLLLKTHQFELSNHSHKKSDFFQDKRKEADNRSCELQFEEDQFGLPATEASAKWKHDWIVLPVSSSGSWHYISLNLWYYHFHLMYVDTI